jgi:hypothetical protein
MRGSLLGQWSYEGEGNFGGIGVLEERTIEKEGNSLMVGEWVRLECLLMMMEGGGESDIISLLIEG